MISTKIKTSDVIAETLEQLGITHVFGIIGAGNVHLFESISRRGFTEIICVHHEQAAAMAMQTYYRVSGRISACLATTGAGSTNAVTGVVSAWADSIPGLVIAGNENSRYINSHSQLRMYGVQGYDSIQMVDKVTKYAHRVIDARDVAHELEKAINISTTGRLGPVWIEIPMDVQSAFLDPMDYRHYVIPESNTIVSDKLIADIDRIIESLKSSQRPILWLGHGIRLSGSEHRIPELLAQLGIPALVSWAGIDMVDSDHPRVYGRAGVYGQRAANFILQNSDYVLAIGTRLAIPQVGYDLTELARDADIDVVDIDPLEATKHSVRTRESVVCDAGLFIGLLMDRLENDEIGDKKVWIDQCDLYRERFPWVDVEHKDTGGFINSYRFMRHLNEYFKSDQVIVTDMGTALLCGHQVLKLKQGQRLMTSTGLGEMGYGLPAAIGASIARNRGEVMCLNCDGGMMLNLQELQTIVHNNLPIKLFIFNNDGYLMIKHTQRALFKTNSAGVDRATGVSCPDFGQLGLAFGIASYQIRSWEDCDKILPLVQAATGPVICEVFMNPDQLFSPKLGMSMTTNGSLVSSPLEDLSPLIPRPVLQENMIVDVHEKSLKSIVK
jgi:acetolactate synthase-1/2/3 large subunit